MGNGQDTLWYDIVLKEFLDQYPNCEYMDPEQLSDGSIRVTRVINGSPFYVDFKLNTTIGFLDDKVFVCTTSPIKGGEEIQFLSKIMSKKTLYVHAYYDVYDHFPDKEIGEMIDMFKRYFIVWTRKYERGIIIGLRRRVGSKFNIAAPAALRI